MPRISSLFTEKAHLTEEAIGLYVDALRFEKVYYLPVVILSHVADCFECKMEIMEIFSLVQSPEIGRTDPHPFLDTKSAEGKKEFSIAFRAAAVLIIGLSVGLVSYYFRAILDEHALLKDSIATKEYVQGGNRDTTPIENPKVGNKEFFADNFTASPNLENLVNASSRSFSIQVLSPLNGANFKESILFKWKAGVDTRLTLKILSNKEKTLRSISVRGSQYFFSQKLPPGIYYWKLESKDELLHLGKFVVKQ